MASLNHLNPSKDKVPHPILKQSQMGGNRRSPCPQILKIRSNKASVNKINNQNAEDNMSKNSQQKLLTARINYSRPGYQNYQISHKNSQETILTLPTARAPLPDPEATSRDYIGEEQREYYERVIKENEQLMADLAVKEQQLSHAQKQCQEAEQKYIRLLEITNERSQSQIKILVDQGESRVSRSKLQMSNISEQAQKLKQKLEGLDLSAIRVSQNKQQSFKLSEMII